MLCKETKSIFNIFESPYITEISKKYGLVSIFSGKLKYDEIYRVYFAFKV